MQQLTLVIAVQQYLVPGVKQACHQHGHRYLVTLATAGKNCLALIACVGIVADEARCVAFMYDIMCKKVVPSPRLLCMVVIQCVRQESASESSISNEGIRHYLLELEEYKLSVLTMYQQRAWDSAISVLIASSS